MTAPSSDRPYRVPFFLRGGFLVSRAELAAVLEPLRAQVRELQTEVAALRAASAEQRGEQP